MAGTEYAHELGHMLEASTSSEERVTLCKLLAATGVPDAQGYLLDALAEESDERVIAAIKEALGTLGDQFFD
ncbi:MAG: hypothetical protein Q7W51_02270 [Coriobacteriia bacterium]|nr:hypothetical protein [Coriobacteriia bacterium]